MAVNFSIWCEPRVSGAEPENDIHLCLTYVEELDRIAKKAKVRTLSSLTCEDEEEEEPALFDAKVGVETIVALLGALRKGAKVTDPEETAILIEELGELHGCLSKAARRKARFCFILI